MKRKPRGRSKKTATSIVNRVELMTKYLVSMISVLIIVPLFALCTEKITIDSKAFAQLLVPIVKSNTSRIIASSHTSSAR